MRAPRLLLLLFLFFPVAVQAEGIGLGGKDVRVQLKWLEGPITNVSSGDYGRRLEHAGKARFFEIHVPPGYNAQQIYPLVMVFHGGGSYPDGVRYESRMDEVADRNGFVVVYPGGSASTLLYHDRFLTWNDGRTIHGKDSDDDDIGFVKDMLADLKAYVRIDPRRIYAAGYSNGAQFTYRVAKQLPDIAAIASVAGQRGAAEIFPLPSRPMPVMQFSGKLDRIAPYEGGKPAIKVKFDTMLMPVTDAVESWAKADGCTSQSQKKIGAATETLYAPCAGGAEVVLWTLEDGGHTWPGGQVLPNIAKELGPVNHDIFAAEQMWMFFKNHPLVEK